MGFNNPKFWLILFSIVILQGCRGPNQEKPDKKNDPTRLRQYMAEGKRLYKTHCANCHQLDGTGLKRLYPPIKDSDLLKNDPFRLICIIRYGLKGQILVNGIEFNMPMSANLDLSPLELAELSTYILKTWGEKKDMLSIYETTQILDSCKVGNN